MRTLIKSDGSANLSFIKSAQLAAIDNAEGLVINIGNTWEITVLKPAERVITLMGSASSLLFNPHPEDDPLNRRLEIALARNVLNWESKVSLE